MVEVKQHIFALVGDMQKVVGEIMKPFLPQFIEKAISELHYKQPTEGMPYSGMYGNESEGTGNLVVCNNACWCLGEIAVAPQNKEVIQPYIVPITEKMLVII